MGLSKLDYETHNLLIAGVKKNLPYEMCAWYARIGANTFTKWMMRGRKDIKMGKLSIYATLVEDVQYQEAIKVAAHLRCMEKNKKGWKARLKILEKRWYKFFGKDVATIEEIVKKIEGLNRIGKKLNRIHGVEDDGREVHTESNQEERCVEENVRCEEGQEDNCEAAKESRTLEEPKNA